LHLGATVKSGYLKKPVRFAFPMPGGIRRRSGIMRASP
jgi:hypothetical protein